MRIQFLGSGTSHGVPMIACTCPVCRSSNPRDRRLRPSIAVHHEGRVLLVDTTPDLRTQALEAGLTRVDAVCITHTHADHIFGMDELRRFNDLIGSPIDVFADPVSLDDIRRIFRYVFVPTQEGGGKPRLVLREMPASMVWHGLAIRSFTVMHGLMPIRAYRFGSCAYVTDVSYIPPESMAELRDLDVLVLDAVRPDPHPTHFGLGQALEVIGELRPRRAFLTHLSHRFDHDATNALLPANVRLSYDGLVIDAPDTPSHTVQ